MNVKTIFSGVTAFAGMTVLAGTLAGAEPAPPAGDAEEMSQAMAVVGHMADSLAGAPKFSVTIDMGFDAVQDSGQKIEFGETREVLLERPNHLRVDTAKRSGEKSTLTFDGQRAALYEESGQVYAIEPIDGDVDEVIRHLTKDLEVRVPLAEMLSTRLKEGLIREAREAAIVEESVIAGVLCDHLALRGTEVDMQVWVAKGDQPLPQRVVITYKHVAGRPQFWAQFSHWNFSPETAEALFAFEPPQEAKKIAFSPVQKTDVSETPEMAEGEVS
ncbi:MAG: DUF2092 domain-containing protein [Candidatus Omnitrophota bacterium]|jgi:hypothetical protein